MAGEICERPGSMNGAQRVRQVWRNVYNRWPAAHRFDAARLYRLALEKSEAGARYHAVAEEGIPAREIAEAIGGGLKYPRSRLRRKGPPDISAGLPRSRDWIFQLRAR